MKTKPRYEVVLRDKDLRRDTFRSGGPGGQNQNKVETGVRYTHLPSGVAAASRSEKSQHANDALAMQGLKDKLLRLYLLRKGGDARAAYLAKPEVAFGSQIRSYVMVGQRRVTDHETGWQGDPNKVLDGDLDDLLVTRLVAEMKESWITQEAS